MKRYIHPKTAAEQMIEEFDNKEVDSCNKVESSSWIDDDEYEDTQGWERVESKDVQDFDGFWTKYSLWYNEEYDEWCTVFGDYDLYHPWDSDHDMDFEDNEQEARDWFESYTTDDDL